MLWYTTTISYNNVFFVCSLDKRTHCDPPKDIEHGNWILQESYLSHMPEDTVYGIGSRIIFECQDHYHLIGPGTIECDVAGYWSGPAPICLPKGWNQKYFVVV